MKFDFYITSKNLSLFYSAINYTCNNFGSVLKDTRDMNNIKRKRSDEYITEEPSKKRRIFNENGDSQNNRPSSQKSFFARASEMFSSDPCVNFIILISNRSLIL
jgi:hypothetical protein